ncbi:MAG: amino acid permease, partial [bacterium]|nr:amino acid permease [bacterium]
LLTSISAMMMAGPRVYARMAEDGLFPGLFAFRGDTPMLAVALQSVLAIAVLWWSDLAALLGYVGFTLSLSAAATVIGLFRLRLREGAAAVPIIGFPVVPGLFVVATLGAVGFMVMRRPTEAMWGLASMLIGVPIYFVLSSRSKRSGAKA